MTNVQLTAEDQKHLAEAELFKAQAKHYAAQTKLHEANTRRVLADARSAEYHAETSRISCESAKRQELVNLTGNHHHKEFWFNDGVDETSVGECAAQLAVWDRLDKNCDMTVKINSPGGSVFDGLHLFDDVMAYSKREWDDRPIPKGTHHTTVIGRGMAASMGGILLQAFDTRIIGPECWVLIHEISTMTMGKLSDIKEDSKWWDRVADRVADVFVRRSGGKITKATFKRKWDRSDWWLSSDEALGYGFVDAIG